MLCLHDFRCMHVKMVPKYILLLLPAELFINLKCPGLICLLSNKMELNITLHGTQNIKLHQITVSAHISNHVSKRLVQHNASSPELAKVKAHRAVTSTTLSFISGCMLPTVQ